MAYRIRNRALDPEKVLTYDPEHPEQVLAALDKPATAIIDGSGAFNDSTKEAAGALLASNNNLSQVGYHEDENITYNGQASPSLAETGFVFNEAHTRGTDILLARDAHALLTVNEKEGFRGFAQKEGRLRGEGQTYELAMPEGQEAKTLIEFQTKTLCVDALQDAKDIYRHCTQEIRAELRNQMMVKLLSSENHQDFVEIFKQENCNALFITKPEKSYSKPGSYFKDNKKILQEDIPPADALKSLYLQNKKLADVLNIELEERDYSELIDKMPPVVSAIATELECECEVEAEAEIEAEIEVEIELEQNQELEMDTEDQNDAAKGRYPPREFQSKAASVSDNIHPAYDLRIRVTEAFLPYERNQTVSKFKREAFQRSMFNIGEVYVKANPQRILEIIIEDPLYDMMLDMSIHQGFVYDIRLGKALRGLKSDYRNAIGEIVHPEHLEINNYIQTPEFYNLIAQIKFLDGRISGYSPQELAALKAWLLDSGPEVMKNHLLDEVLLYRYKEKSRFENSQLGDLFRELI